MTAPYRILVALRPELLADLPPSDLAARCARWGEELGVEISVQETAELGSGEGVTGHHGLVAHLPLAETVRAGVRRGGVPVAGVALDWLPSPRREGQADPLSATIRDRGVDGFRWAIRHLAETLRHPPETLAYGPDPEQVGDLRLPEGAGPHPVAVLLHGGWWRSQWARDLMDPLATDLARRGLATWNVEYRRAGPTGGGWPCTLVDVAAAAEALVRCADRYPLDLARVVVVGHSAGGQLGMLMARDRLRGGVSTGNPRVVVRAVVGLAPVCDMLDAERRDLGRGAAAEFLGGTSAEVPDRYRLSSPAALVPLGVRQLLVHGGADQSVPPDMSERYQELASGAGDEVALLLVPGAGHRDLIETRWPTWPTVAGRIWELSGGTRSSPSISAPRTSACGRPFPP